MKRQAVRQPRGTSGLVTSRRSIFFLAALLSAGFGSFSLIHLRNQHRILPQTRSLQPIALGRKGGAGNGGQQEPLKLVGTSPSTSGASPQLQQQPAAAVQSPGCAPAPGAARPRLCLLNGTPLDLPF